ncbi:MAG: DUF92 domain-containing protein [Rhodothermales bacterium]|nr:DUF92 domain-containing protein [Rhodothermales bacterium]
MTDGPLITIAAIGFVVVLIAAAEISVRLKAVEAEASRSFVHIIMGVAAALLPIWFPSPNPFYPVAAVALIVTAVDGSRGMLHSIHGVERKTSGTAAFAASFIVAAALCWSIAPERSFIFSSAMLVLALADPLAADVGARNRRSAADGRKTFRGSIAFLVATTVIVSGVLAVTGEWADRSLNMIVLAAVCCSLAAAAAEHVVDRGYDNLAIVVAVCTTLHLSLLPSSTALVLASALVVAPVFALLAFRARLLDIRGSAVAGMLAATILLLWDWRWIVPGLLFFTTASALSRIGRGRKATYESRLQKGSVRDPAQVIANGGVPWLMLLGVAFLPADLWFWGYAGAFGAATADTWSTEVGMLSPSDPRSIRTGRRVPPGTSGAVTVTGMVAALVGAAVIAVAAAPFAAATGYDVVAAMVVLSVAGLGGSLVDTFLGASVQALYVDSEGYHTEVENGNRLVRGWRWLNNDGVNAAAGLAGATIAIAGFLGFVA